MEQESTLLFSDFRLEPDGGFFRGEIPIHLPPRELGALRLLLAHAGRIVTPSQIKHALWGDIHVTSESVPRCLSSLRARLQPDDCIQTVYKRGYRIVAEVQRQGLSDPNALPRLAILPFVTDGGVTEHLGAMAAEETIARLSNAARPLAALLARDSVFNLSSRGLTALEVGERLRADLVLAGTLRGLLSHIRLRVEMIRVSDGVQIWVEDMLVDRDAHRGLEAELSARLEFRLQSGPLRFSHSPQMSRGAVPDKYLRVPAHPRRLEAHESSGNLLSLTASVETAPDSERSLRCEAYDVFLRGHHEWQTLERHRMQDGLQLLSRAIELDPSLAAAKIDLVHLAVTQAMFGFMSPSMASELVHRTADSVSDGARSALRILPARAWVNFHHDRDLSAALWAFSLSEDLPYDPWITRVRSLFAVSRHRFDEAITMLRASIELDPYSPWLNSRLAWALHLDGQAGESIRQIEHCLRLFPDHQGTALYGSQLLAFNGEPGRAVELAQNIVQRQPYFDLGTSILANALACAGRPDEALGILERLQWLGRERFVLGTFNAPAFVALGALDAALAELQASNDSRCPWFFQVLADPRLKPLHDLPGFQELQGILPRMEADVPAESEDLDSFAAQV